MYSILIIGGDMRQVILAKLLEQRGYDVKITGFDKLGLNTGSPKSRETFWGVNNAASKPPDYVFLPIPYNNNDGSIKTPYSDCKLGLSKHR